MEVKQEDDGYIKQQGFGKMPRSLRGLGGRRRGVGVAWVAERVQLCRAAELVVVVIRPRAAGCLGAAPEIHPSFRRTCSWLCRGDIMGWCLHKEH